MTEFGWLALAILALGICALAVRNYQHEQQNQRLREEIEQTKRESQQEIRGLKQRVTRLIALTDVTPDALLVVSFDHVIVRANKTAQQLFGENRSLDGKTIMQTVRNHELDAMVDAVRKAGEELESQISIYDRSYRVRGSVVEGSDLDAAVVTLSLQDISELLRLARARRDMVANIVHDLGTPISSIRLLLDTLTMGFGKNPERDQRLITKIAGETDNLQHMTRELIDLSSIESGRAITRMVDTNLHELVGSAIQLMETQAEPKKLTIRNEVPNDLLVLADPEQIKRVISNLLHNSIKFTAANGEITVSASASASDDGQMAKVAVQDTGTGIPPQERSRIFERFYQVDSARSGQKTKVGAGLGLSIAKHIVSAHGGDIWAEPNIPQGTTILFTLALAGK
ncbi:MAG: PAS domain-containing sensor histidine kinase [Anaerolineae bacterium]